MAQGPSSPDMQTTQSSVSSPPNNVNDHHVAPPTPDKLAQPGSSRSSTPLVPDLDQRRDTGGSQHQAFQPNQPHREVFLRLRIHSIERGKKDLVVRFDVVVSLLALCALAPRSSSVLTLFSDKLAALPLIFLPVPLSFLSRTLPLLPRFVTFNPGNYRTCPTLALHHCQRNSRHTHLAPDALQMVLPHPCRTSSARPPRNSQLDRGRILVCPHSSWSWQLQRRTQTLC